MGYEMAQQCAGLRPNLDFDEQCENLFIPQHLPSRLLVLDDSYIDPSSPALSRSSAATKVNDENKLQKKSQASSAIEDGWHIISNTTDLDDYLARPDSTQAFAIRHTEHSWSQLNITQSIFDRLNDDMQTQNALKEMITYMGERNRDEIAPPTPRILISQRSKDDRQLKTCYALRYIALNQAGESQDPWSLRQYVARSSFGTAQEHSSWIFVALPDAIMAQIRETLLSNCTGAYRAGLETHMYLVEYATSCWRPYLFYLVGEVEKCNGKLSFGAPGGTQKNKFDLADIRIRLKNIEDQIEDARVSIENNKTTIGRLLDSFTEYCGDYEALGLDHNDTETAFKSLWSSFYDSQSLIVQFDSLKNKTLGCTQIAASFLELENGLRLTALTEAAHKEQERAAKMAEQSQKDAAAVKALTVIASIFLPTTVVLNFFSASFIDTSHDTMILVGRWWLFIVVAAPLTFVTLGLWALWMQFKLRKLKRERENRQA